jgi:hypothetical protein
VDTLRARTWRGSQEPRREPRVTLGWPRTVPETMLDRAAGCLFGLAIGGNLGPETELALVVARSLVGQPEYDGDAVDEAVTTWVEAGGQLDHAAPLVRAIGIGIWAYDPSAAVAAARRDSPDAPANCVLAGAIAVGVRGGTPDAMRRLLEVNSGLVLPEAGDTAWTSAVAGALAGAAYGRSVFPVPQIMRVLTWRPDKGLGVAWPRPEICWTDDLVDLAEALLCQGQRPL